MVSKVSLNLGGSIFVYNITTCLLVVFPPPKNNIVVNQVTLHISPSN